VSWTRCISDVAVAAVCMFDHQMVEQQHCERDQVKSLRLIMKLIEHDAELLHEFIQCDGYAMIAKVCTTNRCIVGQMLIKVHSSV